MSRQQEEARAAVDVADARNPHRLRTVMLALIVIGVVTATFGNHRRVQDWDPQYARTIVERTNAYGGSFYENGIFNKGPLELVVHKISSIIGGFDGHWFVVAAIGALLSLLLALSAQRTARFAGAGPAVAVVVGTVAFFHFTFSDVDYAGVVYSRNLTAGLLAIWWLLLLSDRAWKTERSRRLTVISAAVILGLAVQTLVTTAISGLALTVATYLRVRQHAEPWERLWLGGVALMTLPLVVLGAHAWYFLRGALEEFWASWWLQAQYMSTGTGRSLGSQLGLAWDNFYSYHQTRPLVFAVVAGFVVVLVTVWRRLTPRERTIHAAALAWWAAAWIELILSQRYSSHYFVVTALPVAIMAALLVGRNARLLAERGLLPGHEAWWPVAALVVTAYLSGSTNVRLAVDETIGFRGTDEVANEVDRHLIGNVRTSRAILDLVTDEGDPLLGWTNDPWPYLSLERVSATRFIWKSFMVGEIYLGQTSRAYVLPQTWDWFVEDLAESNPKALARVSHDIDETTPFAEYASANFTSVYESNPVSLYLLNPLATAILETNADRPWTAPVEPGIGSGWTTMSGAASFSTAAQEMSEDLLPLTSRCSMIDGVLSFPPDAGEIVTFVFEDPDGIDERLHLGIDRGRAFSRSDFVLYEEIPLGDAGVGEKTFRLVIGSMSAALVMDGRIVAALRLPSQDMVSVRAHTDPITLDMRVGQPPPGSGC